VNAEARRRTFAAEAVSVATLTGLTVLLYRKALGLWLTYDDPSLLRTLFDYRFVDTFTNGRVWPQQLFTPLLHVAFRAEWRLFGFEVTDWYAMQIAIACATTLLVYAAVRQFLDWKRSLAAAVLFTTGAPLCSLVTQLSTLHYYLAISFCALAVIAYVVALRRPSIVANVLSILCYFLAMLAKEVAIPLPLLLLALPLRDARTRFHFLIGHGVAAVAYFIWRYCILGTILGAYGWQIDAAEWPKLLLMLPWRITQGAAGAGLAVGLTLVAVMALTIVLGIRSRRALLILIAAAIVAGGPLLPLAKEVNRRYVVVPWLALSIAFTAATTRRNGRLSAALLVVVPILAIGANREEWRHEFPLRRRASDEARIFFYDMPPESLLRHPLTPPAAMGDVKWLKTIHFGRPAGGWFYDDLFLCGGGAAGRRVFEYERTQIVEVTQDIPGLAAHFCGSIRTDAPLSATLHFRKPVLYWELGPYTEGRYSALLGNGVQAFEIPRRDALNLPGTTSLALRIRYDSPAGWTTYSPELAVDVARKPDLTWHR
jgi:hypothetical protein